MEDRSTTTSATTALQGGNENHGNDSETQVMAIGPTTTSVTSTLQGGIQVGNHNNLRYRNCAITYNITNITVNCQQCHPAEDHVVSEGLTFLYTYTNPWNHSRGSRDHKLPARHFQQHFTDQSHVNITERKDTPRDLIPSSSVHTTTSVRLVDCKGRELELGDVVKADLNFSIYTGSLDRYDEATDAALYGRTHKVMCFAHWFGTDLFINVDSEGRELGLGDVVIADRSTLWSLYAGDGMTIGVNKETGKIVHESINVEEPFRSIPSLVLRHKYSRIQSVQRAKGKIGQKYDHRQYDFVVWCHTDMTMEEWLARN